jgi:hypothetical protein
MRPNDAARRAIQEGGDLRTRIASLADVASDT